jgi:hypothetical protein
MTNGRDEFSKPVIRNLRERVGGHCSRPECGRVTVAPNEGDQSRTDVTGRAAHITGAAVGGPRHDFSLSAAERRSAENGIWLCGECADLIDKNNGSDFSVPQLRSWKRGAEQRQFALARLRVQTRRPAWLDKLKSPNYINVPRLVGIAGQGAFSAETLAVLQSGFPRGRQIIRELIEAESTLRQSGIRAVDVEELLEPQSQVLEGLTVSFHRRVWAKNARSTNVAHVRDYSFKHSPQLYFDSHRYRYFFPFDPIWLTTNTAQCMGGSLTLAGLGLVKSINHEARHVFATPLTFGVPEFFEW